MTKINIKTTIHQSIDKVWEAHTEPKHIVKWNFASPEWHCPKAENDLKVGGEYLARMEAKDGSFGFDFRAVYTEIVPQKLLSYRLEDGREVAVSFENKQDTTMIDITFDAENQNPTEMQQAGWQAILDNFKKYVETPNEH